jgi:hypothetical protein
MLSGNPDKFAVWYDAVDAWSTPKFANGCLGYFIGKELVLSSRSTLGVDLHMLSQLHCMNHSVEDVALFERPVNKAYRELCRRTFPDMDSTAIDNDFTHLVSAESLSDDGHYIFLVESGRRAKLIYGFKNESNSIREIFLDLGECQSVLRDAIARSKTV